MKIKKALCGPSNFERFEWFSVVFLYSISFLPFFKDFSVAVFEDAKGCLCSFNPLFSLLRCHWGFVVVRIMQGDTRCLEKLCWTFMNAVQSVRKNSISCA